MKARLVVVVLLLAIVFAVVAVTAAFAGGHEGSDFGPRTMPAAAT